MNTAVKQIKEELKALAAQIQKAKQNRKLKVAGDEQSQSNNIFLAGRLAREYRHRHIAYCTLRGRPYEQIERSCRYGNDPSWSIVDKYRKEYEAQIEAARTQVA